MSNESQEACEFTGKNLTAKWLVSFDAMRKEGHFYDLVLKVGAKEWQVHRHIIASSSEYFYAMLTSDLKEKNQTEITLTEVSPVAVDLLISYAYTGKVRIDAENVENLLGTANIWGIDEVKDACADFMKKNIHPSNCLGVAKFAQAHSCKSLVEYAEKYFLENFIDVTDYEEFQNLPEEQISSILSNKNLRSKSYDLCKGAMKWVKSRKEPNDCVFKIMQQIRFDFMTKDQLISALQSEPLLRSNFQCLNLLIDALTHHGNGSKKYIFVKTTSGSKIYDPVSGKTASVSAVGEPTAKDGFAVCSIRDRVFVVGGICDGSPTAEIAIYSPLENTWKMAKGAMTTGRYNLAACSYRDLVHATGGRTDTWNHIKSAECYNSETDECWSLPGMIQSNYGHKLIALDDFVYSIGRYGGEKYDIKHKKWEIVKGMEKTRYFLGAAACNGKIIVLGGSDSPKSAECYNPQSNCWNAMASCNFGRQEFDLVEADGSVYAIGGVGSKGTIERYDLEKDSWTVVGKISEFDGALGACAFECGLNLEEILDLFSDNENAV